MTRVRRGISSSAAALQPWESTVRSSGVPVHRESGAENALTIRDSLGFHFQAITLTQTAHNSGLNIGDTAHVRKLAEEALKASWSNDLEDAGRFVTGVPECMPLVARLEHKIARLGKYHVVAKQCAETPSKHVAVLVLSRMAVQWGANARGDIGCSTKEKCSPASSPQIMNLTPTVPKKPSLPSRGPIIFGAITVLEVIMRLSPRSICVPIGTQGPVR